jgi:hypothetical protein
MRCTILRSWGLLTRCGGAESRYRKPRRSFEGTVESVFRPLAAGSRASEGGVNLRRATVVGWRKNDSVQTCQKGAAAVVLDAGEG